MYVEHYIPTKQPLLELTYVIARFENDNGECTASYCRQEYRFGSRSEVALDEPTNFDNNAGGNDEFPLSLTQKLRTGLEVTSPGAMAPLAVDRIFGPPKATQ